MADTSPEPRIERGPDGVVRVQRFSAVRRAEHWLVMVTFILLVLTGFPQRFPHTGWALWLFDRFGGLDATRVIHRVVGLVFAVHATLHIGAFVIGFLTRRMRPTLLPIAQDVRDAWQNLRYYVGRRASPPELPKFDYRQKFEYLGMILGGLMMIVTGLILLFPVAFASFLPAEFIPAAQVAHSNEAMLALLVLVVWHIYGSHLSPEVFPMDRSIFNGYLTLDELRERHAREYRRLFPDRPAESAEAAEAADADSPAAEPEAGDGSAH